MRRNGVKDPASSLNFTFFDSTSEFADVCAGPKVKPHAVRSGCDDWAGGTVDAALAFARHGDMEYVSEAERLVEKIDSELDTEGMRPMWTPAVVGSFPLVPAFLAGTPESMIARTDVPDARGDLDLWVEMGCSANVKQRDMLRRGVCVLAAAMALSRVRNVRIVCFTAFKYGNMAIPLRSPMDISEACGMITQTSVTRRLMYGYSNSIQDSSIPWAEWGVKSHDAECYRRVLVKYAEMPPDAELVTMQRLGNWGEMDDAALVDTINRMLRRVAGKEEA